MFRHGSDQDAMASPNIALIGFMAAGKTTVGRALADRLGYRYVDLDERIVAAAGRPIPAIFADEGEAGFRRREREAVAAAAAQAGLVIACGGGVARDPDNVATLRRSGRIVWLRISAAEAARRILADGLGRPMIDEHVPARTYDHVLARSAELLAEREPDYEAAADLTVEVDHRAVAAIVEAVLAGSER